MCSELGRQIKSSRESKVAQLLVLCLQLTFFYQVPVITNYHALPILVENFEDFFKVL